MGNSSYELLALSSYIEEHGLCAGSAPTNMKEWVEMVQKSIDENQPEGCPYSAEDIVTTLVSTCMASINPVNDKTRKISSLITEYCLKWSEMTINGQVIRPPYVMNAGESRPSWEVRKNPIALTANAESELMDALAGLELKNKNNKKKEFTDDDKKSLLENSVKKAEADAVKDAQKKANKEIKQFTAKDAQILSTTKKMRHKYVFDNIVEKAEGDTPEKLKFVYSETRVEVEFKIQVSGKVSAGKSKTDVESKEETYTITKSISDLKLVNDSSLNDPLFVLIEMEKDNSTKVKRIKVTDKNGKELSGLAPDFKDGSLVEIANIGVRVWRFDKTEKKTLKRMNMIQKNSSIFWGNYYMSKRYETDNYPKWKVQWDESEDNSKKKRSASKLLEKSEEECMSIRNSNPSRNYQTYLESSIGKAHPDVIKYFLENFYGPHTDSEMMSILENFCIGIDCSGFVTRAIAYVMENMDYEFSDDQDKSTEANLKVQYKTLGLSSGEKINDDKDFEKYYGLLTAGKQKLNPGATVLKFYCENSDDTRNDYVYNISYKAASRVYSNKKNIDAIYANKSEIDDNPESYKIMGSRLIYRFNHGKLDRINKFINPADDPQITSLRPGDIITMSNSEDFDRKSAFHIVLICDVGYDIEGPFFITADSSPSTLYESLGNIKDRKKSDVYSILKRPDSMESLTQDDLDEKKVKANQRGSGVRYILHRDFQYFNILKFIAFRRPYVFDLLYRNVKFGSATGSSNNNQEN